MTLPWNENWEKSYRIKIGVREYEKALYDVQESDAVPVGIRKPITLNDHETVPENALKLSNLVEDGSDRKGFTFSFNSNIKLSQDASSSENSVLELYNPNQELIELLTTDGCIILIEAGYQQKVVQEYSGDVVSVTNRKQGSDTIYTVKAASGALAMRNTMVSLHYDESVSEQDVIIDMIGRFPSTAVGTYGLNDQSRVYKTGGRNFTGKLVTNFDNIMKRNNLNYAHTNGIIVISPYRLLDEDYNSFARTNYHLPESTLKKITDVSKREDNSTGSIKAKLRTLQVNTNYLPIQLGQFITIPETDYTKLTFGTYQVQAKRTILSTKSGGGWDVVLEVSEV